MTGSMTKVVHCKREAYDVYIGRPSKWGNPFSIGKDGTRSEVIQKYSVWLSKQPNLLNAIGELRGKVLGCWCHPQPCHGDVLLEYLEMHKESTLSVRRSSFGTVNESEEVLEVRNFETTPAMVSIGMKRVISLGDYNSVHLEVKVEVPCYVEEVSAVTKRAVRFVQKHLDAQTAKFDGA